MYGTYELSFDDDAVVSPVELAPVQLIMQHVRQFKRQRGLRRETLARHQ